MKKKIILLTLVVLFGCFEYADAHPRDVCGRHNHTHHVKHSICRHSYMHPHRHSNWGISFSTYGFCGYAPGYSYYPYPMTPYDCYYSYPNFSTPNIRLNFRL